MSSIRFISDGHFGCKDYNTGEIIIEAVYKSIEILCNGLYCALSNDYKWGIIDNKQRTVIPFEYSDIIHFVAGYFGVKKNGHWNLFSSTDNSVILLKNYDGIDYLGEGLFSVVSHGFYGVVDNHGGRVLSCQYDGIRLAYKNKILIASLKGEQFCFDIHGNIIQLKTSEDYEQIEQGSCDSYLRIRCNELSGLVYKIDETHFVDIIPCEYSTIGEKAGRIRSIFPLNDVFILASMKAGESLLYGFIDWDNNITIPFVFEDIVPFVHGCEYTSAKLYGKWGIIDRNGKWLASPQWEFVDNESIFFSNGLIVVSENGKFGVCRVNGELVLPCIYESYKYPCGIKSLSALDEKFNDKQLDGAFLFRINGKAGLFSKLGKTLIEPEYSEIKYANEGICAVRRGEKWGYYNLLIGEIVPCLYCHVEAFSSGTGCIYSKDDTVTGHYVGGSCPNWYTKGSVVDRNGTVRIDADIIIRLNDNLFWMENDNLKAIVNSNGAVDYPIIDWSSLGNEKKIKVAVIANRVFVVSSTDLSIIAIEEKHAIRKTTLYGDFGIPDFIRGVASLVIDGAPCLIDLDWNKADDYRFSRGFRRKYLKDDETLEDLKLFGVKKWYKKWWVYTYASSEESAIDNYYHSFFQFSRRVNVSEVEEVSQFYYDSLFRLIPPY